MMQEKIGNVKLKPKQEYMELAGWSLGILVQEEEEQDFKHYFSTEHIN